MNIIKVDESTCGGCKNCYRSCWVDVIRWDDQRKKPIIAYPEDCVDCNYCEIVCTTASIKVSPDWAKPFPNTYA
jgi:NAD-dependent dihydropyrimidine dehydrogenase PreA subunit